MKAELMGGDGQSIEAWNADALSRLSPDSIRNDFAYNKFTVGPYGLVATMGAEATVALPATADAKPPIDGSTLRLTDVDGHNTGPRVRASRGDWLQPVSTVPARAVEALAADCASSGPHSCLPLWVASPFGLGVVSGNTLDNTQMAPLGAIVTKISAGGFRSAHLPKLTRIYRD
jgi:TQO small subunit DoxA